ncbi:MAG: FGGY family carbohydrate kinase, partial [Thermoleophilaceae bacterium]
MADYVGAIDQGTTSTRFMVFDHSGAIVASDQREHEQIYPRPGWVEHDAEEIWRRTQEVIRGALENGEISPTQLAAVGITNQRETAVLWERDTGTPVHNAIVWQDTRTDKICRQLSSSDGPDRFRSTTGLPISTYFSGPKIRWIFENVDGVRERAERGEVLFGNLDSFLIWRLTGGPDGGTHVT